MSMSLYKDILKIADDGEWHYWTQFLQAGEYLEPERATQIYLNAVRLHERKNRTERIDNSTKVEMGRRRAVKLALTNLVKQNRLRVRGDSKTLEYQVITMHPNIKETLDYLDEGMNILRSAVVDAEHLKKAESHFLRLQRVIQACQMN
jgi:hypothetical protein